jgi:hypothetical protein
MDKERQNAQDLKSTGTAFVIFTKIQDAIKVTRMYRSTSNKSDLFVYVFFFISFFFLLFLFCCGVFIFRDFNYNNKKYHLSVKYGVEPSDVNYENLGVSNGRRSKFIVIIILVNIVCKTYLKLIIINYFICMICFLSAAGYHSCKIFHFIWFRFDEK